MFCRNDLFLKKIIFRKFRNNSIVHFLVKNYSISLFQRSYYQPISKIFNKKMIEKASYIDDHIYVGSLDAATDEVVFK